eukprot:1027167-Pelagomonas_calceolata.AAC.9
MLGKTLLLACSGLSAGAAAAPNPHLYFQTSMSWDVARYKGAKICRQQRTKPVCNWDALLRFVLLGGVPFSLLNVIGISLNTAGGIWYAQIKYSSAGSRSKPG